MPRRAERPDAVQRLRAGEAAAVRALRAGSAADGALARGTGVQHLLPPSALSEGDLPVVWADTPPAALSRVPPTRMPPLRRSRERYVCDRCGAEEALQERGLCGRCALDRRLTRLLGDQPQRARVGLEGLFDALSQARSAKDTLRWLDMSPATQLLAKIASGELPCTHEALDALESSTALRHLHHLLVATDALPPRDPGLARLERWIEQFLTGPEDPALRTFAQRIVLRRCRRNSNRGPLGEGQINTAKTELKSAAALLDWLTERGRSLADCEQTDIDAWLAGPRLDRYVARLFVRFAIGRGLMGKLRKTAITPAIPVHDRVALAQRLLHENGIETRDRVAGVLVVAFAQSVTKLASLTVDDVAINEEIVAIRLGKTAITLPQPLADHLRELIADRCGRVAAQLPTAAVVVPRQFPRPPDRRAVPQPTAEAHRRRVPSTTPRRARRHRRTDPRTSARRCARNRHPDRHQMGRDRRATVGRLPDAPHQLLTGPISTIAHDEQPR
jgi:hypothetical protein